MSESSLWPHRKTHLSRNLNWNSMRRLYSIGRFGPIRDCQLIQKARLSSVGTRNVLLTKTWEMWLNAKREKLATSTLYWLRIKNREHASQPSYAMTYRNRSLIRISFGCRSFRATMISLIRMYITCAVWAFRRLWCNVSLNRFTFDDLRQIKRRTQ